MKSGTGDYLEEEILGTAERRQREKEQRRNAILDAAEMVFFSKGVKEATLDEVAQAAELSKGALYLYFDSKEDMYFGISLRAMRILREMLRSAMEAQSAGIEKVRAIGQAYYEFSQTHPDHFEAMLHFDTEVVNPSQASPLALECHRAGMELLRLVAEAVAEGVADGTIRSELDPMKTAILLWAQTDGVIRVIARKCEHLKEFENLDLRDLIQDFFEFAYNALRPSGGRGLEEGQSRPTWEDL